MRTRTLLVAAAFAAAGCGVGASVSQDATPGVSIGILRAVESRSGAEPALLGALAERGYIAGQTLQVFAEDPAEVHAEREDVVATVEAWVDRGVDAIVALSTDGARLAAETAPDVPVLFISNDPVASGLVRNEDAPEANLTGVTFRVPADRTLDLARRALGDLTHIGYVAASDDPTTAPHRAASEAAARELGIRFSVATFRDGTGAEAAVEGLAARGVQAVVVGNSPRTVMAREAIAAAASANRLPLIANTAVIPSVVVLGPNSIDLFRQLGEQVDRVLDGTPVREVPVADPRRFDILLDAATAADLGITIPEDVLQEANEVRR